MILATAATSVEVYFTIVNYLQSPIMTTYDIKTVEEMTMPTIHICPTNPIDNRKVLYSNYYDYVNAFLSGPDDGQLSTILMNKRGNSDFFTIGFGSGNGNPPCECEMAWVADPNVTLAPCICTTTQTPKMDPPKNVWDLMDMAGLDVDTFFTECSFGGRKKNCSEIAKSVFDLDYGRCFLLKPIQKQRTPGKALSLVIDTRSNPKIDSLMVGASMSITDSYNPLESAAKKFYLTPQTMTKVALKATKFDQVKIDTGSMKQDCVENKTNSFQFVTLQSDLWGCQLECLQQITNIVCNCLLPFDRSVVKQNGTKVCEYDEYLKCFNKVAGNEIYELQLAQCNKGCSPLCHQWQYSYTISSTTFNNRYEYVLKYMNITGEK